ncbi:complement regulator-acquiring protein [Borreliella burgdorferi]|uniref:complement regulator-acquiring protein n=2 Tax=Borreliella burgdorferi TaxID=139 RepID=UPI0026F7A93E|nr:complement regulator-acquiring protein [Borreliella burgdorferi]MDO7256752.1 complement regulator-acquiring protein [Borreliella burgdorferi]
MKNFKLNTIKLNVITAILTLICISCAPFGNVNPNKLKNPITSKNLKKTKRSNHSRNLKKTNSHTNSENSAENNQNLENESQNSKSSNQNPQEETAISKLEKIGKDLEAQKKEKDTQIEKISNDAQYDFLENFKLHNYDYFMHNTKMTLKKIIYSSLNYEKEKILTLKEILEKLDTEDNNRRIAGQFLETSRDIQLQQEDLILKKIQDTLQTLSKEKAEELLQHAERDLKIKQNFVKALNATIDAYNKNSDNIKTDVEALANHMKKKYSHPLYLLNQAD